MKFRPVIVRYAETPYPVGVQHRVAADFLARDVTRVMNRITKMAHQAPDPAVILDASFPIDRGVAIGVRAASTPAWWDGWRVLLAHGLVSSATFDDVFLLWHMTPNQRDVAGVGMPASPHAYAGDPTGTGHDFDPSLGGIAACGGGQLINAIAAGFEGISYRYVVDYATHEVGHAEGRHHTPDPVTGNPNPNDVWNKANSIMSYGYAAWAAGDRIGGQKPNPLLAIPAEIQTWRSHEINHPIPERVTATDPGWVDDLVLVRRQDIDALYDELETGNGRGRLLFGAMAGELGDPIE